jgi:RNA polymerase sigma-70 factor (ECF subfamily)
LRKTATKGGTFNERVVYNPRVAAQGGDATALLQAWGRGEPDARDRLLPIVYDELRRVARRYMHREPADHTLDATALVNEAYLRLAAVDRIQLDSRAHFLALAARIMRRLLVDSARARTNEKRGGHLRKVPLDDAGDITVSTTLELVTLDAALSELEAVHPRKVRVVELRFFAGLSVEQTADTLSVSTDTVKRDWRFAKMWLLRELSGRKNP